MADKTYNMTVTLSDGKEVNAGNFTAPQGESGCLKSVVTSYERKITIPAPTDNGEVEFDFYANFDGSLSMPRYFNNNISISNDMFTQTFLMFNVVFEIWDEPQSTFIKKGEWRISKQFIDEGWAFTAEYFAADSAPAQVKTVCKTIECGD